jgi:cyanophycinase-like exopeptidase
MSMGLLVVMGSGETAPTMVKIHRQVFAETAGHRRGPAVMLDTPFGFQLNADDLVRRTCRYFADSVGTAIDVVGWRRADQPVVERARALALLQQAGWVFAGPGSPTYALRQWRGTGVPEAMVDVARHGGTLVFGSAAACTLGTHAIPVYEIYKVGEEPRWEPGLDLLGQLTGMEAVVVPHFDNAEGGGHDTRYCYLGEQRLTELEAQLADEIGVLGVDEHTALLVDVEARTARVAGNGVVTVRRRGRSLTFAAGSALGLDRLDALLRGTTEQAGAVADGAGPTGSSTPAGVTGVAAPTGFTGVAGVAAPTGVTGVAAPTGVTGVAAPAGGTGVAAPTSLGEEARRAGERFDTALATKDVDGCVAAVLDLEAAIVAWSTDTLQSDDTERARRTLRALVVRLGELARIGARDPREAIGAYVELLLEIRDQARAARDFATSDLVRDRLAAAGIEVRDTPDGAQWLLSGRHGR